MSDPPAVLRIRAAQLAEAPRLAALAVPEFGVAWAAPSLAAELEAGARAWVAEAPGTPTVGFVLVRAVADEAEVRLLAVAPAWRRRGAGRALLAAALRALAAAAVRRVFLEVRAGNAAARALYAEAAFSVTGRRAAYYPDGEDALILARDLAKDASGEAAA